MRRFWALLILVLLSIWASGNAFSGLVAWLSFAQVLQEQPSLAGDMTGAVLSIWTRVAIGIAALIILACFILAAGNWRNLFKVRAVAQIALATLLLVVHGGVLLLNSDVSQRRDGLEQARRASPDDTEAMATITAFEESHQRAKDLYQAQTALLGLLMLAGLVLLSRRGGDEA